MGPHQIVYGLAAVRDTGHGQYDPLRWKGRHMAVDAVIGQDHSGDDASPAGIMCNAVMTAHTLLRKRF
jgi:hypothetical protein